MILQDLGYTPYLEDYRRRHKLISLGVGRVISEHKERYIVKTAEDEFAAEIIGNLRFSARDRSDLPAVGDWVAISEYEENRALIHTVFPRKTVIERQAVGRFGQKQVIAANIDCAFIVQAVDRDFNINRIERYLTICNASKVKPIILLSKIDLIAESTLENILERLNARLKNIPVIAISNATHVGYDQLNAIIEKGKTYCLLGSSGVGKSTLLNNMAGKALMQTDSISSSTQKGKHVTSHRELVVLANGGIFIDNPGMREVGITGDHEGLEITFETIIELAHNCKFRDCTHIHEAGCAVLEAVENGTIDRTSYENYLKMERERIHFEASAAEKRRKDREFGKMVKRFKKEQPSNKY